MEAIQSTEQLPSTPRPTGRGQFLRYLLKIGIPNDMKNGPELRRLFDMSEADFDTKRAAILAGVQRALLGDDAPRTNCPNCNGALRAPSLDVQLANFERWQQSQPPVYHWSESEMANLRRVLGPGDILQPAFAQSVFIAKADGSLVRHEKKR